MDVVEITRALLRCRSITPEYGTPEDGGAQAAVAGWLTGLGFAVTHLRFGNVDNLFARIGQDAPHLCFAGHTDVVPPGDSWQHDPFGGEVADGYLYGRGACDMKGAIAAFIAAAARHLGGQGGHPCQPVRGSISLLITGDEEGAATYGTVRVLEWMADHGQRPDACIVGEPTNPRAMGEMIKIGRRGSLNARIVVNGTQGHVAYPQLADNPVHRLVAALAEMTAHVLDAGSEDFQPSSLQVTSVDVGNPAGNVIPALAQARLNIRFNDLHTGAGLSDWLRTVLERHAPGAAMEIAVSGEAFLAGRALGTRLAGIIERVCGRRPVLDTGGGTSDARFIARAMPVAEFGLVGASMHKVDERVAVADLHALADIYAAILQDFLP